MRNGQNQSDQTSNLFWLLILIIILALLAWWGWHSYITRAIFFIRKAEYIVAVGFQDIYLVLVKYLHFPLPKMYHTLEQWDLFMQTTNPADVIMPEIEQLSHDLGIWLMVPAAIILTSLAYFLYFHDAASRFTKQHSMKSLQACGVKEWPQIAPVTREDLINAPLDKGPWAMGQLPVVFAQKHGFVHVGKDKEGKRNGS